MKIEKKKLTDEAKWSTSAKKGLAAMMGLSAAATITACAESGSPAALEYTEQENPDVPLLDSFSSSQEQETSSASQMVNSSSSQVVVDIPLSSSTVPPIMEAGVVIPDPDIYDNDVSSSFEPSSSSTEDESVIIEPVVPEVNSSSSEATPCGSDIYLCPNLNDPENMIVSMVTTFESTDLDV